MEDLSRRKIIKNVIGGAILAATSASVISCSNTNGTLSSKSVVTKTKDGQEIRLTVEAEKVIVEKISNGKIIDAKPSGSFTLQDGKSIIVEKGIITGGDSGGGPGNPFAAFALLRVD